MREDAALAREEIRLAKEQDVVAKQNRRLEIKSREEDLTERRNLERLELVDRNRRCYEERVADEELATAEQEKQVAKMERMEMQLIQKLKKTQIIQQQAFEDLEHALNGDITQVIQQSAANSPSLATNVSGPRSALSTSQGR